MYFCKTELLERELFLCIKMPLSLTCLEWLMCHKTKPNQTKSNLKFGSPTGTSALRTNWNSFVLLFFSMWPPKCIFKNSYFFIRSTKRGYWLMAWALAS